MPGRERSADRWREQQGHSPGLALVPSNDQAFRIRKHLSVGRATGGGLLLGDLPALILHLSAVEAHGRIVAETGCKSTLVTRLNIADDPLRFKAISLAAAA